MFNEFDTSGDNQLSVEEFARAIYNVMLADNEEYSEDDEDEHLHWIHKSCLWTNILLITKVQD